MQGQVVFCCWVSEDVRHLKTSDDHCRPLKMNQGLSSVHILKQSVHGCIYFKQTPTQSTIIRFHAHRYAQEKGKMNRLLSDWCDTISVFINQEALVQELFSCHFAVVSLLSRTESSDEVFDNPFVEILSATRAP